MANDPVIEAERRPVLNLALWGPVVLIVAATLAIVYYGFQVAAATRAAAAASAQAGGSAVAREIVGFIDREHERLRAFAVEKQDAISRILAYPEDISAIDALQGSVKRMFRGAFAFSITDAQGRPLFEDFDGLVGPVCQESMRAASVTLTDPGVPFTLPPIHPVPDAYHFDLITPWKLPDGSSGLFFISMSPDRIADLIAAAERASGNRILLLNRDDPTLIEVSGAGARDRLGGDFRLDDGDLVDGHFSAGLPGTHWRLVVLPDGEALADQLGAVHAKVVGSIVALWAIAAAMLFLIRRAERNNSTLFTRSLQSSVSRQRAILQSMVDGMVTINASGEILNVNQAITRLFGYTPSELIGSNVRVLMPEPDRSAHDGYLRAYLETGESHILGKGREVRARRKDGSTFPLLLTLGESVEGDEHIFVGILHDLSAYVAATEAVAAQAVKLERSRQELDEISQVAAKDLQVPLQRIAMLGEMLASETSVQMPWEQRVKLKSLGAEARDMSELARGIADFARADERPPHSLVDMENVVQMVREDLATRMAQCAAEVELHGAGQVEGDAKQLYQVIWNLFDNALKFRDPARSPRIVVTIDSVTPDAGLQQVRLRIQDNGIGIPGDQLESVFDAFRRLHARDKYPGMGLGLSICRKIIDGLGGRITASSVPGEGSVFEVVLPRANGEQD